MLVSFKTTVQIQVFIEKKINVFFFNEENSQALNQTFICYGTLKLKITIPFQSYLKQN